MRSFVELMGLRWLFLREVKSVITETSSQRSFRGYTWFPRMVIWRTVGRLNPRGSGCSSLLTVCSPYGSSSLEKATRVGSSAYIHPALAHLSHYPLPANRSNRCNHIFTTDALDYAKSRCHSWDKEIGRFDLEQPNLTQYVQYFY